MAIDPNDIIRQLAEKGELNAKDLRELGYTIEKGDPPPGATVVQEGRVN